MKFRQSMQWVCGAGVAQDHADNSSQATENTARKTALQ